MLTRIHVNQHVIRYNKKNGTALPTITVKQGSKNRYCREVNIDGPSTLIDRTENPLGCGASIWLETNSPVTLIGECNWAAIKDIMFAAGIVCET